MGVKPKLEPKPTSSSKLASEATASAALGATHLPGASPASAVAAPRSQPSRLQALCERLGICASYQDAWGQPHTLDDATLRRFLGALGIAADDEAALAAAWQRIDAQADVPAPMRVIRQDQAKTLQLAARAIGLQWLLQAENGVEWHGEVMAANDAPPDLAAAAFVPAAQTSDKVTSAERAPEHATDGVTADEAQASIELPADLPIGYHRLRIADAGIDLLLAVCPAQCHRPQGLVTGERWWGPTVQLYALRSKRNWGIGDFSDLAQTVEIAAAQGAAFVGINPVHALFPELPEQASPYSPSSRIALNAIYLDVEAVADFKHCKTAQKLVAHADFQHQLAQLREAAQVDYAGVATLKRAVLSRLYRHFCKHELAEDSPRAAQFRAFQQQASVSLRRHALFEALQSHLQAQNVAQDPTLNAWASWPEAARDPSSPWVAQFQREHLDRIEFFDYLQWQCDEQLSTAQRHAKANGMPLGLYLDMAVGVNESGSETWSWPGLYALDAHVGAPPESYNPAGQNWGLPPMIPSALQAHAYRPFIDLLRANMRHAGALRLDHVMALQRLFWILRGDDAGLGTYVHGPFDDLLNLLALESVRAQCLVIGEDLGNVPPNFRETMGERAVHAYGPLYFERRPDGRYPRPGDWKAQALAVVGTHDLPTLRAWWRGDDITTRDRLALYPSAAQRDAHRAARAEERSALLQALQREGLLPGDAVARKRVAGLRDNETDQRQRAKASAKVADTSSDIHIDINDTDPRLTEWVYAYLGRGRSQLVGVQFEDVLQQLEQVNVPSTTEARYPNWRIKLSLDLDQIAQEPRWLAVSAALREARRAPLSPELHGPQGADPDWAGDGIDRTERPGSRGAQNEAGGQSKALRATLATALVPRATYRIQFHAGMRFDDATRAVPYLDALGVSHLYASPYLQARQGSLHGYDVVDPTRLNAEIGDEAAHERLCQTLQQHGMHQLIDIVPNHMGVLEADNLWWLDVLECGQASAHARSFDIEWHDTKPELDGKVLLPVLGDAYGRVLEAGELVPVFDAARGSFHIAYYGHRFPIDPRLYAQLLSVNPPPGAGDEDANTGLPAAQLAQLAALAHAFAQLPAQDDETETRRAIRRRDKAALKQQLAQASERFGWLAPWIEQRLNRLKGEPGRPGSFDALDALIGRQAYRLACWRVGGDDINYRRFFDVSGLAALRMERREVFDAVHEKIFGWLAQGRVAGLRVDHPDGLADPQAYFERLQTRHAEALQQAGQPPRALYVAVEKILGEGESLPTDWAAHGDTGYRYSNQVNGVFVDGRREADMDRVYQTFVRAKPDFSAELREAKRLIMSTSLASDLHWLTEALHRIALGHRTTQDFSRNRLRAALMAVAGAFDVYRSYLVVHADGRKPSDEPGAAVCDSPKAGLPETKRASTTQRDRQRVDAATAEAMRQCDPGDRGAIDFLHDVLLGTVPGAADAGAFIVRWQQFTAPVMAKAMEDTAFYRYHRLVSLNDVGGDPRQFGLSVAGFHEANQLRARETPHTMLGTSTHDSKRSEDVRARLDVLSEIPDRWQDATGRWSALNRGASTCGAVAIDRNDEYLLYQTLVGIWPAEPVDASALDDLRDRVQAYLLKATREAKRNTCWTDPNEAYEKALAAFIDQLLGQREGNLFIDDLERWLAPVAAFGFWNSLNQVVLKLTSPGVPDLYQGCETWNFSLVDPDNRRSVDFTKLPALLSASLSLLSGGRLPDEALTGPKGLLARLPDGRLKMLVTARLLHLRRDQTALFRDGAYLPLSVIGPAADHVIAYARSHQGAWAVVIASRLLSSATQHDPAALGPSLWAGSRVVIPLHATTDWRDSITGRTVRAVTAGDEEAKQREGQGKGQREEQREGGPSHEGLLSLPLDEVWAGLPFAVLVPQ